MAREARKGRGKLIFVRFLVTGMLASLLIVSLAGAAPDVPGPQGWGEEGIKEVGVEWINDFPGTADDRSHWDESCDGLYNQLLDNGWTGRFRYTDWSAWEQDFKDEPRAGGGTEDSIADTADIAMVCTHGSGTWDAFWGKNLSSVYFGSTVDDHHLSPGDAYRAYGDQDLEWLAFDSCSVLSELPAGDAYFNRGYWAASMNGLHLLLGFKNTMYVVDPADGPQWAHYMLGHKFLWWWIHSPRTVKQSWFDAVDDVQPGGVCARVLAQENDNFNDYLHDMGYVSPDYGVDGDYFYWDHCSCTPKPAAITNVDQIETLPIVEVVNRTIDIAYVLEIAQAFPQLGTRTAEDVYSDDEYYYLVDNKDKPAYALQVDRTTGGYKFENLSKLGVAPVDPPTLLSAPEALAAGNKFFAETGQALPAAGYRNVATTPITENIVQVTGGMPGGSSLQAAPTQTEAPVLVALSWGRKETLNVGIQRASGVEPAATEISFVGAGARTKMYLGDMGETLGVQGGSRDIKITTTQVTVMDAATVWDRYLQVPTLQLAQVPYDPKTLVQKGHTLGEFEQSHLQSQKHMIPAWVFTVNLASPLEPLPEDFLVYLPAAAEYIRPQVKITSPAGGVMVKRGQPITFEGAVEQYGMEPFTYEWSSSQDGVLGAGAKITAPLSASVKSGETMKHVISLKVTDANGQTGIATVEVTVMPNLYLPSLIQK